MGVVTIKLIISFFIKNLLQVMGDSLLLSSVFQFSRKIRQSIDKTAGKIRWVVKNCCYCWKCLFPSTFPAVKKKIYNNLIGNVHGRSLSFKKALLPMAFLAFRRIWNEYFFHYSFCLFHFMWREISGKFTWTEQHPAEELFQHMQYCTKSTQPLCKGPIGLLGCCRDFAF